MAKTPKKRLDEITVARGLVATIEEARQLAMEGYIIVDGQKSISPAQMFPQNVGVRLRKKKQYIGRAALKLEGAFEKFDIDVSGKVCIDIGACHGGFTEVLLLHGAKKVYAVDTCYGKLHDKLRADERVINIERQDIRDLGELDPVPTVAVTDISLIPLREILPHAKRLLKNGGDVIALLKPQYETRDPKILHNGVITKQEDQDRIRDEFIDWVKNEGYNIVDNAVSPIKGGTGNIEFLVHIRM